MAPFYDLISTKAYPEISQKMAMKVGKENRFDWIMVRHWQQMAEQLDLKYAYLKRQLKDMAGALEHTAEKVARINISQYNGEKTISKICKTINTHIAHVRTYL